MSDLQRRNRPHIAKALRTGYHARMPTQITFIRKYISVTALVATALAGCASTKSVNNTWALQQVLQQKPQVLLLGEQHDAPEHHEWERNTVTQWAAQDQLAAVVLEMADAGHSTKALPANASESAVQTALAWNNKGWPWQNYGPTVMAAVQAGVPVYGGNLPRAQMRDVMQQTQWDAHLPSAGWQRQLSAIREGHCDLLPDSQLAPMARIQLAKDASMARTAQQLVQAGKTVILIAGRGHVLRSIGIPTWLPADTRSVVAIGQAGDQAQALASDRDWVQYTPATPPKDHCAELHAKWKK